MDPITHGITGALLGKAFFSNDPAEPKGRVALFAATLGSVFPDVDVTIEAFSRDPMAIARYHRGFTHSFVGLPLFAVALAGLTWRSQHRRGRECPSFAVLLAAYAMGLASHIVLDAMTTFGTRIWSPISTERAAWDLLVIIDFTLTAIVLLPQVIAWIYRDPALSASRALRMWILFSFAAAGAWEIARAVGFPFALQIVAGASALFGVLFVLPARFGWKLPTSRRIWCQAGVGATVAYLIACGAAHHAAMARVEAFAAGQHIAVERLGALPMPPSLLDWSGAIRTADGVYFSRFDLRDAGPPQFSFVADSPPNRYIAAAREHRDVGLYLWFSRFPTIHYSQQGSQEIIDFSDARFFSRRRGEPAPFTFRVVLDTDGRLVEEGWIGALTYPRRKIKGPAAPAADRK